MTDPTRPGLKSLLRPPSVLQLAGPVGPRLALAAVLAASVVLHLVWGAALEASNDEAYHFLYAEHLDLSYFDHPPMTAWVAKAGLLLCGNQVSPLSLRLGFVLMFAASGWVLARFTARWFGEWAGVYAAILLNVSGYYAAAGRNTAWYLLSMAAGLYVLVTPGARRVLLTPGPYLAVAGRNTAWYLLSMAAPNASPTHPHGANSPGFATSASDSAHIVSSAKNRYGTSGRANPPAAA